MEGKVELTSLVKRYAALVAVNHIDLVIAPGSYCCLLGPSGCGKTSILRMIAGHEAVSHGQVHIDGTDIGPLPPARRSTAMMLQNYGLGTVTTAVSFLVIGACLGTITWLQRRRLRHGADAGSGMV